MCHCTLRTRFRMLSCLDMASFSVLLAEPDASQRQIIEMLLLVHDFDVTMALDAREALAYLQNNTPDLIIAATDLPQMDGFDLSRKARGVRRLRVVPVILAAPEGSSSAELRTEAELAGADLLLLKPLGDKNLGERAVTLIRQSRQEPAPVSRSANSSQERRRPAGPGPDTPNPVASVLEPVSSGQDAADSDENRQLRRVVADLTAENAALRKQLTNTGRATSAGGGVINDLRERLTRANELLEEYRKRYPEVEQESRQRTGLGSLLRRKL